MSVTRLHKIEFVTISFELAFYVQWDNVTVQFQRHMQITTYSQGRKPTYSMWLLSKGPCRL
jgi:hypothetical protein